MEKRILRHAAAVHFTSQAELADAKARKLPFREVVIPLGVELGPPGNPEHLVHKHPILRDRRVVLYLSRLDPMKNVEGLLKAFAALGPERANAALVIAGSGEAPYVAKLQSLAQSLGLAQQVIWLGHVDGACKASALSLADLFVLPSFTENFGIAAVEALLAGLPCVLGRGVAIASQVQSAGAGLAVEPEPAAIAQALATLVPDRERLQAMGERGRQLARRDYSTAAMATRLVALYRTYREWQGTLNGVSFFEQVGVLVLTYDEAPNIARTLGKLEWAKRIVIVDSGSTDGTLDIALRYPHVEILHRPFDTFASQCNFGLSQIDSEWVLSLDADYELSDGIIAEIGSLRPADTTMGYRSHFVYRIHGKPLRGSLYPPRVVLYRKQAAFYRNEGHGHRVTVSGDVLPLAGAIYHDDRKPLGRWLASQQLYAFREAEHLLSTDRSALKRTDRIRLAIWPAPILVVAYVLLVKGCLLDGWPGWFYAMQRLLSETMIALAVLERRLNAVLGAKVKS